jgi:hypothetical protein
MAGVDIAGSGSLRIGGVIYECSEITATKGGKQRTKIVGMRGVAGDRVEIIAPSLTATIIVTAGSSVSALTDISDETAEVQMADGRSYMFEGASGGAPPGHSASEGTCDISLEAMSCTEVGA